MASSSGGQPHLGWSKQRFKRTCWFQGRRPRRPRWRARRLGLRGRLVGGPCTMGEVAMSEVPGRGGHTCGLREQWPGVVAMSEAPGCGNRVSDPPAVHFARSSGARRSPLGDLVCATGQRSSEKLVNALGRQQIDLHPPPYRSERLAAHVRVEPGSPRARGPPQGRHRAGAGAAPPRLGPLPSVRQVLGQKGNGWLFCFTNNACWVQG